MNWLTSRLVDDWHKALKRYSVRLAAGTATLATLLVANQTLVLSLLTYLPRDGFARVLAAVSIGIVVFVVPTLAVLWRQSDGGRPDAP